MTTESNNDIYNKTQKILFHKNINNDHQFNRRNNINQNQSPRQNLVNNINQFNSKQGIIPSKKVEIECNNIKPLLNNNNNFENNNGINNKKYDKKKRYNDHKSSQINYNRNKNNIEEREIRYNKQSNIFIRKRISKPTKIYAINDKEKDNGNKIKNELSIKLLFKILERKIKDNNQKILDSINQKSKKIKLYKILIIFLLIISNCYKKKVLLKRFNEWNNKTKNTYLYKNFKKILDYNILISKTNNQKKILSNIIQKWREYTKERKYISIIREKNNIIREKNNIIREKALKSLIRNKERKLRNLFISEFNYWKIITIKKKLNNDKEKLKSLFLLLKRKTKIKDKYKISKYLNKWKNISNHLSIQVLLYHK